MSASATSVGPIRRAVPILRWLPGYRRAWAGPDIISGLVVASLAIPTALGYSGVADVPVQVGLYSLPGALIAYAIFGSSRQVSVGPSSTVALMSGAIVFNHAGADNPLRAIALSSAMAVAAGVLLVLAGALRFGWATHFLSRPVITGFSFGLGLTAILGELPHLLGLPKEPNKFVPRLIATLSQLGEAHLIPAVIGLASLAILFVGARLAPRWPWALTLMVVAMAVSVPLDPAAHGIEVIGTVPSGLPAFGIPDVGTADLVPILLGGLALAVVGLGEGLSAATVFAARGGYRISEDQEFVGAGAANIAAGMSGGMAVCGSLSRTSAAVGAGARSQLSSLVAAGAVLAVILALTGLLEPMPRVILSAVVIQSVWFLLDVSSLRRYARIRRNDVVAALTALVGVLLLGPLYGLLVAVGISLLGLVYRSSVVIVDPLGRIPLEKAGWGAIEGHPERRGVPGLLVLRLAQPVFWASAAETRTAVLAAVDAQPGTRGLVLDLEATGQLDTTAVDQLQALLADLRTAGVELFLARLWFRTQQVMEASGFLADLGPGRTWHSISQAVHAAATYLGLPDDEEEQPGTLGH